MMTVDVSPMIALYARLTTFLLFDDRLSEVFCRRVSFCLVYENDPHAFASFRSPHVELERR